MKNLNIDYTLVFILILLGLVSLFTLFTIEPSLPEKYDGSNFMLKQALWFIAGGIVITAVMLIDYDRFHQITWILYGVGLTSLLMLFAGFPAGIVHEANGAVSWFKFPVIGTIQPGEFMKVILVLTLAHVMVRHNTKYIEKTIRSDLGLLAKIIIISAPPMALLAVQPDLGGLLVLIAITGFMILVSGVQWRILFSIAFIVIDIVLLAIVLWYLFPGPIAVYLEESVFDHVSSRFYGWLNPQQNYDAGYQLILAMMAIGSGQLFGKGIGDMEVYVPERHTDMIFTAISEQFGFVGASLVVMLFFLLVYRLIHIALLSNDTYGSYLVTGLVGMFAYQIFQNIGMSIQLLPITGLPLPFISYGGSSTITYMLSIGIVLNVHSRTKEYMFSEARWKE
ncbi:cell division protein FtsW, lipid II flippase [Virgibacillus subterraneus]|uniref:Cell division protein FtsW, lipid II flippase n=1 Tax=Virgibacillus subterraneus TaxID=621109 RepID=A0A1H9G2U9_9BACI|nr:FtsW/RodA/SpoVE family cell cycle protein [Virgibacillus subterraneus]SEQ44456.1 cell division protein FtsW, lipid II flippase [Virgibacillus subterraneus]